MKINSRKIGGAALQGFIETDPPNARIVAVLGPVAIATSLYLDGPHSYQLLPGLVTGIALVLVVKNIGSRVISVLTAPKK